MTALISYHLDEPERLVGLFSETATDGEFAPRLPTSAEEFDVFTEPDALVGTSTWSHLLPRTLLTARSNLDELAAVLEDRESAGAEPLPPICHPVLLSALSVRASGGRAPLRVLPPRKSVTDRVHDCRQRGWANVTYGTTAGDWTEEDLMSNDEMDVTPAGAAYGIRQRQSVDETASPEAGPDQQPDWDRSERDGEDLVEAADRSERLHRDHIRRETDSDDSRPPTFGEAPSLPECIALVGDLLGSQEWITYGDQVGVAGAQGLSVGFEQASEVEPARWEAARSMGRCYLT